MIVLIEEKESALDRSTEPRLTFKAENQDDAFLLGMLMVKDGGSIDGEITTKTFSKNEEIGRAHV